MVEEAKEIVLEPTKTGLKIIAKGIGFSTLFLGLIVKIDDVITPHTETEIENIRNKDYEDKEIDDILNSPKTPYSHDFFDTISSMGEGFFHRNMGGSVFHEVGKVPFKVVKTEPKGEVKIVSTTNIVFIESISENVIFVKKKPNLKNLHEVRDRDEWIKIRGRFQVGAFQEKDGKTLYFSNMFYYIG